ncbi:hypothetical protein ACVOMT_20370 (plasmid) [Sphingomonas panni]|uniref:hypothetical protein n=1 Tax=Sphingomonas panni TaxID=237612 RepID=UPI003703982B
MFSVPSTLCPLYGAAAVASYLAKRINPGIYGAAAVASYLAKRINPGTSWSGRMKAHWLSFPEMPFASAAQGGFLEGWDQEAIWA